MTRQCLLSTANKPTDLFKRLSAGVWDVRGGGGGAGGTSSKDASSDTHPEALSQFVPPNHASMSKGVVERAEPLPQDGKSRSIHAVETEKSSSCIFRGKFSAPFLTLNNIEGCIRAAQRDSVRGGNQRSTPCQGGVSCHGGTAHHGATC